MKMFKNSLILISILLFTACAGSKKVVTETKEKAEILTEITEKKLDTTLVIPKEKVELFIPSKELKIEKDAKPKVFKQRRGRSSVVVKIDSSGIDVVSNCDSIAKRLDYYEKTFKEFRKTNTETKSIVKEKKGYTLLQLILYMIVTAVVSFTAGYLIKTFKIV